MDAKRPKSRLSSLLVNSNVAPDASEVKISRVEASKAIDALQATLLVSVISRTLARC